MSDQMELSKHDTNRHAKADQGGGWSLNPIQYYSRQLKNAEWEK